MSARTHAALSASVIALAALAAPAALAAKPKPPASAHKSASAHKASTSSRHSTPAKKKRAPTRPAPKSSPNLLYTNWAGYQSEVKAPQSIRGTWTVPRATWPGRDGYSAMWVGLGGGTAGQGELIQAGTESDSICVAVTRGRCTKWKTSYYPWIETFPSRAQERITNLALSPGDTVDVTVSYLTRERRASFTLCNRRTADCVATDRSSAAPQAVAEAVLERTSGADGRARALANVGTASFSDVRVTGAAGTRSLGRWPAKRVTMYDGATLASTGTMSRAGDAFAVTHRRPA